MRNRGYVREEAKYCKLKITEEDLVDLKEFGSKM